MEPAAPPSGRDWWNVSVAPKSEVIEDSGEKRSRSLTADGLIWSKRASWSQLEPSELKGGVRTQLLQRGFSSSFRCYVTAVPSAGQEVGAHPPRSQRDAPVWHPPSGALVLLGAAGPLRKRLLSGSKDSERRRSSQFLLLQAEENKPALISLLLVGPSV